MKSSTQTILEHTSVPKHIAVIMDGNGRWAKKRFLPRVMGHKRGLDALENMVKHCAKLGVQYLTVFAFSTENWRRPEDEVSFLMGLFLATCHAVIEDVLIFVVIGGNGFVILGVRLVLAALLTALMARIWRPA